eukprot:3413147-Pyramimonas_sp.AAC.1
MRDPDIQRMDTNQDGGVSPCSISRGPRRAPGPSNKRVGMKYFPWGKVETPSCPPAPTCPTPPMPS